MWPWHTCRALSASLTPGEPPTRPPTPLAQPAGGGGGWGLMGAWGGLRCEWVTKQGVGGYRIENNMSEMECEVASDITTP